MNATPLPDPADLARWRALAERLAREAGDALREAQGARLPVTEKAAGDWTSALDREIEERLQAALARECPDHAFWGEESHSGTPDEAALRGRPTWVVDPIDGTMNFVRGYPQYAVSIALLHATQPVVGCILDPVRNELFSAAAGQGAWLGAQRLRVSQVTRCRDAVAATVFPKPTAAFMPAYLRELAAVMGSFAGVRRAGSMALEMAYLAAGRVDAFWEHGMGAWDAAAGWLLIEEAGGQAWSLDAHPWFASQALAAAATPALRDEFMRQLRHAVPS